MKTEFKAGDGMTPETSTSEERKRMYSILQSLGYESQVVHDGYPEQFKDNNLVFSDKQKGSGLDIYLSNAFKVTNPMTFEQMNEVLNNKKKAEFDRIEAENAGLMSKSPVAPLAGIGRGGWKPVKLSQQVKDKIKEASEKVNRDGGGLRYNSNKIRYDLLHPIATKGLAMVMTKGAEKYAERNWERGMSWTSVLASMKRHIAAFESGEDFDPETGLLHIDHVQANAHFLSAFYKIWPKGDDRRHKYLETPKIGLDIDEVLCDWVGDWTEYRNLETPTSWYFDREIVEEFERMRAEDKLDEFYLSLRPLIRPEDIPFEPYCYITSRPVDTKVTEEWLAKNGFPARPVYGVGLGESKVDVAKEQGIDVFVDDAFHNFKALNEAGILCYLMNAPHNQRYDVGHKRIYSLKDLV